MQRNLLLLLGFGALITACIFQQRQKIELKQRVTEIQESLETQAADLKAAEAKVQQLDKRRRFLEEQAADLLSEAAILRATMAKSSSRGSDSVAANTSSPSAEDGASGMLGKGGMSKMLKQMLKDPAMKEMMQAQQKASLKMMYGPLFKDLQMSPEQTSKFIDLLAASQADAMENVNALLENDPAAKAEAAEAMKAKKQKLDDDLRALLGDDNFAQYQEYSGSIAERTQLNQFKQQSADTDWALDDAQTSQLLQILKEERAKVPAPVSAKPGEALQNLEQVMAGDFIEKQLLWQQDLNRRVAERSGLVLTEPQLAQFKSFQEQQLNLQKFGMEMARKMFGTNGSGTLTVPK